MKSNFFKLLLAIACLLSSTSVFAYDFEVDGIYYDVVSFTDFTCKVVSGDTEYEGDIVIPATVNYSNRTLTVVEVGYYAFLNCLNLTGIAIPNTVISVGKGAFLRCSSLTDVIIADGEKTLNNFSTAYTTPFIYCPIEKLYLGRDINSYFSMFRDMTSLTSLTIGNSVTRIGTSLFAACNNLMELYILNSTPPSVGGNNFTNNHYLHANVYVPQEALEAYQSADTWKNFWNLQGFDATGIGSVKPTNENGKAVYYDLSGRRLNTPRHGLNIVNGKKVMVQ